MQRITLLIVCLFITCADNFYAKECAVHDLKNYSAELFTYDYYCNPQYTSSEVIRVIDYLRSIDSLKRLGVKDKVLIRSFITGLLRKTKKNRHELIEYLKESRGNELSSKVSQLIALEQTFETYFVQPNNTDTIELLFYLLNDDDISDTFKSQIIESVSYECSREFTKRDINSLVSIFVNAKTKFLQFELYSLLGRHIIDYEVFKKMYLAANKYVKYFMLKKCRVDKRMSGFYEKVMQDKSRKHIFYKESNLALFTPEEIVMLYFYVQKPEKYQKRFEYLFLVDCFLKSLKSQGELGYFPLSFRIKRPHIKKYSVRIADVLDTLKKNDYSKGHPTSDFVTCRMLEAYILPKKKELTKEDFRILKEIYQQTYSLKLQKELKKILY